MGESEVARLRRQIELELESMQHGMHGFAVGTTRHKFIRRRMDQVGVYQNKLAKEVGEDNANQMVYSMYVEAIK